MLVQESARPLGGLGLNGFHWAWPRPAVTALEGLRLPPLLNQFLASRGLCSEAALRHLDLSLRQMDDPQTMADMPKATARLCAAIDAQEPIVVYGDYDVDGVCATALTVEGLRSLGARVDYYIPDRRAEGYGLNADAMIMLAERHRLLLTVDCGISAVQEVAVARAHGLDVIVVDHHQVPATLPAAQACLNPHRTDCPYPFNGLCAAGVAFLMLTALRRVRREAGAFAEHPEPDLRQLLDLVAVATVADMVPMLGLNRVLVAAGLRMLPQRQRPGLLALCAVAQVDPNQVCCSDVGFRLGPRINARGRMGHAKRAVELMLTEDRAEAQRLAEALDRDNLDRRQLQGDIEAAALASLEGATSTAAAAIVVAAPDWHPGVLGLVASRLVRRFNRPSVVIGEAGKGSGRSIEAVNLYAALKETASHLSGFGGHPAAAGLTLKPEHLADFRAALVAAVARQLGGPVPPPLLRPDLELPAAALCLETVAQFEALAPYGQGNLQPLFVAHGLPLKQVQVLGRTQSHLKLSLGPLGCEAMGWNMGALAPALAAHSAIDAVFTLERNCFRGQTRLQLNLSDLRPTA